MGEGRKISLLVRKTFHFCLFISLWVPEVSHGAGLRLIMLLEIEASNKGSGSAAFSFPFLQVF